ncbi:MAG TPA: hypothetical protein VHO03_20890 [Ignavibacteriales bacterium]|nr:hypothetical protein [Ignavibacteriales bacterium]
MRLGQTILLLLLISLLFISCRYTILNKEALGLYPPDKIYGQWISAYKGHGFQDSTGLFRQNYYEEHYSMTIDKDSSFIIFKTEDYGFPDSYARIKGTYRISKDTMTISIEKYPDKVEKYLFKLDKGNLSFVLISKPFPDIKEYPSMRPDKKQTLEKSWKRY